jgi:hypothetical protein
MNEMPLTISEEPLNRQTVVHKSFQTGVVSAKPVPFVLA